MPVPAAPQAESSNSDSETTPREEETQNLVKRAQSMRSPTKKAPLQSFGSMRSPPGLPRPKSGQVNSNGASRPKSPPPRPPPVVVKKTNSISSSGYQRPVSTAQRSVENTYDDCEFVENEVRASNDDIYSVIDEIPPAAQTLKRSDLVANRASNGSDMGLLNEIVNELEKINGDSIYSGKPVAAAASAAQPTPADPPKSPQRPAPPKPASSVLEEKAANASASTYHRPPPANAPVARVKPTVADKSQAQAQPSMSSFKPAAGKRRSVAASASSPAGQTEQQRQHERRNQLRPSQILYEEHNENTAQWNGWSVHHSAIGHHSKAQTTVSKAILQRRWSGRSTGKAGEWRSSAHATHCKGGNIGGGAKVQHCIADTAIRAEQVD